MQSKLLSSLVSLGLAVTLSSQAAEITIPDISLTPDGTTATEVLQTEITPLNGGSNVLPSTNGTVVYTITTFTLGANSDAHFIGQFNATGGQNRLGVRVQDNGMVDFAGTGDPGRTSLNLAQDLAGQTITLLIKQYFDASNDGLRATLGTGDDTLMTVWVNPDNTDVEGSGITAGDLHTLWNSNTYRYYTHTIENQTTPGTAGTSFISDTSILTGSDATWANALALATGSTPLTGIADAGTSTLSASPAAIPANDITTATLTVTVKDAGSNPVANKEVSLSGNGSASVSTSNNISNAIGEVSFSVKSAVVGAEVFTATVVTDDNLVITDTASVDFQELVPIGPVDAVNSTVAASSSSIPANGIATSTITVTLKDSSGQLVVGEGVTLAGSPSSVTIIPVGMQTTDVNGQAEFTVSSTNIDAVIFSATSFTNNTTVSQTVDVEFVDPATATAYNINFIDDGQSDEAGLIGVVGEPGETWNQGTSSLTNLVDSTGAITSTVSVSGLSSSGRPISGSTLSLFKANRDQFDKGGDIAISISGLTPDTAYDLYIYALSHNTGSWGDISNTERAAGDFTTSNTVLVNGQSQWLDNAVAGTNGDSFVPNGNYVVFHSIVSDGSGDISVVVDAYDGTDGDDLTDDGDTRLHVNGLQIRPASGMSVDYMNWRQTYYPSLGLPGNDDDGDSYTNDYERIFGLDPMDSTSASPYPAIIDPATGYFSYSRRTQSLANLNYKIWYSTDLDQWFEDNAANQLPVSLTNDVETMGVEIDPTLIGEARLFVQVRATPITGVDNEPALSNLWGGGNTITLLFSEPMNSSSATNIANYAVQQDGGSGLNVTAATLSSDGASVTLTLDSSLGTATGYTVNVDGVTSSTGQSIGSGVSRQFTTWDNDPTGVKVFILAGQSNMVGRGESERGNGDVPGGIGSLRYQVVNDSANYGMLVTEAGDPGLQDDTWVVRDDVNFWWNRADIGAGTNVSKGGLNPEGFGSGPTTFGPEFGFGWAVGEYLDHPVLIIKTAWGGKDLITQFRPPSAVAGRGGVVGGYYLEMIDQVREVLNNLGTEFPEWDGLGYEIAGFGWHQGWNDSLSSFASNEYEANMANFITDVRDVFGKPNLPFSIGTTGMIGAATSGNRLTVVNAQINVANPTLHPELGGNVFTIDTRPFARTDEQSPSTDSTHWRNNGESMWLMGKGIGDGIVDLLRGD